MSVQPIIAYKGFDKNLKCRDFQFEVGKSYEHTGKISVCNAGFHSCEDALDVLKYYDVYESRYALVEVSGDTERHNDDSKICSSKLHVKAEIKLADIITASVNWHFNGWFKKAKKDDIAASKKGGSNLAASGNYSNLAASGDDSNVIVSAEKNVMVKGALPTLICLTHYSDDKPVKFITGQIGKKGLKPDTWYQLDETGKLVEAV